MIIDKNFESTTEQFLLDAVTNSSKLRICGERSTSILDYSNILGKKVPETNLEIRYVTSRSKRIDLGMWIDHVGIKPHVMLSSGIKD